jgi:hypothetical protein
VKPIFFMTSAWVTISISLAASKAFLLGVGEESFYPGGGFQILENRAIMSIKF